MVIRRLYFTQDFENKGELGMFQRM